MDRLPRLHVGPGGLLEARNVHAAYCVVNESALGCMATLGAGGGLRYTNVSFCNEICLSGPDEERGWYEQAGDARRAALRALRLPGLLAAGRGPAFVATCGQGWQREACGCMGGGTPPDALRAPKL